jgi:hypothetical protein
MWRCIFAPLVLALGAAAPVAAQTAVDDGTGVTLSATAAVTPNPDRIHFAAGPTVHARWSGWGVLGLAMFGSGGDYRSRWFAAALSRRIVGTGPWSLVALAGAGKYGETGPTAIERSSIGFVYGGSAEWRRNGFVIALTASDFRGSYDEDDVLAPFSYNVPRITVGIGFDVVEVRR